MIRRAYSLRRRLIGSVLGASLSVWTISMAIVVYVAWHETNDVFDDALKEGARLALVLGTSLQDHGALAGRETEDVREPTKLRLYYQIVDSDGRVLRRADKAPEQAFSKESDGRSGYRDEWVEGQAWRVYVLHVKGKNFHVQVGQPWEKRLDLLDEVAGALVWPAVVLLVLLGGFCWWVIRHLLKPIERTAERIGAKSLHDLEPVPTAQEPRELQPIIKSFNLVLSRLSRALQQERRFTADAAHELRTPLAALRMRIQLMQRQQAAPRGASPATDAVTFQSLCAEVDRCTALVESLLALARLDPERPDSLAKEAVDLPELFAALGRDVQKGSPVAQGLVLRIDCRVPVLHANAALLQSALRTIVDNALRYGPPEGPVHIEATQLGGRCRIAVRDSGPGVSDAERARLGERFFRVLGSGKTGNGLGLSIVARIASLHGATLSFERGINGGGLGVVLEFSSS